MASEYSALLQSIRIQTTMLPDIVINDPLGSNASSSPNPVLDILKPKVTFNVAGNPITAAPYGDPGNTQWPIVRTGLALGAIALGLVAVKYWQRRSRRR